MNYLPYILTVCIFHCSIIIGFSQPAAPTDVKIAINESNRIVIEWVDNSWDEDGYFVERSYTNNFSSSVPQFLEANSTSYTDLSISPSTTYYYRIGAGSFSTGVSYSSAIMVISASGSGIPATPSNLSLLTPNSNTITIKWSDMSTNEDGFIIERKMGNENYYEIIRVPFNSLQYTDTTLLPETTYYYRIASYNINGTSPYCAEKFCATPPLPALPSEITATFNYPNKIEITWTDNASDENGYIVLRSESDKQQEYITVDTLTTNSNYFIDSSVTSGKNYYYKILVYGSNGKNSTDIITVLSGTTSIYNMNKSLVPGSITLFPNPATDYIKIENTKHGSCWSIIDTNGKVVLTSTGSNYIDISNLSKGIYFLTSSKSDKLIFTKE